MTRRSRNLQQFLAERADRLLRTAVLLTGSRETGQDLLRSALERLLRHWRTLSGDPEGYLRRTLCNLAADGFRRRGRLQRKLLLIHAAARASAACGSLAAVAAAAGLMMAALQGGGPATGGMRPEARTVA